MVGARLIGVWAAVALALLALAGGAAAATQSFPPGLWSFKLRGTNGYSLGVLAGARPGSSAGEVQIFVGGPGGRAFYQAPASVSKTTLEADLGSLGRITLRAEPSGEVRTFASSCDASPWRYEPVSYVGEVDFRGEEGYTQASATSASLLVKPIVESQCVVYGELHVGGEGIAGAGLHIGSRHGKPRVQLSARTNGPRAATYLSASIREQRGEIEIERSLGARLPHSVFSYDAHLSSAALEPPAPFAGRGVFRRNAAKSSRWTGNLRVDFPGRSGVHVTGARFKPKLQHGEWQFEIDQAPRATRPILLEWPSTKP